MRQAFRPKIRSLFNRPLAVLFACLLSGVLHAHEALPDFRSLVRDNVDAVVNITTREHGEQSIAVDQSDPALSEFLRERDGPSHETRGNGSGFILDTEGHILTNWHVVSNADEIWVQLGDRRRFAAELIGGDERSDIALLRIDSQRLLPHVRIGRSESLEVGDWVLAIGSPFGFDHSVTAGIVSAKGRALPSERYVPFIQTDVAINPGNSGGPLFNLDGEVVGINSQIFSNSGSFMGLSFAIPIELVIDVADQLRQHGSVERGWLGVHIAEVDYDTAAERGLDRAYGALVRSVMDNSPAAAAGIVENDIIAAFNGTEIRDAGALPPLVGRVRVGESVSMLVLHQGRFETRRVIISRLPDEEDIVIGRLKAAPARIEPFDFAVMEDHHAGAVDRIPEAGDHYPRTASAAAGLLVLEVEAGGRADAAGLRAGDILLSIDEYPLSSVAELLERAEGLTATTVVEFDVLRRGQVQRIRLQ